MSDKRVMLVGTNSGCGKTTITCAILSALRAMGIKTAPFKCGPDYIDPMFHKFITGRPSINLDSFFLNDEMLCTILARRLKECDIGIVEGVMGMYDGIGTGFEGSAFDIAVKTQTPMILIVNAKGMSLSLSALLYGYKKFAEDICQSQKGSELIRGVILNNVGPGMVNYLKASVESMTGLKVIGCFERQQEAVLESRHLGLVTASEVQNLDEKVRTLGEAAQKTIDFEALFEIAATAAPLSAASLNPLMQVPDVTETPLYNAAKKGELKLAVAYDEAFCFYYEDNLELFKEMGIEPVYFSPLNNEPVPQGASGLMLGGGYPENYAEKLSKNEVTKLSIKACAQQKMPMIAECGGFMYLHETIELLDGSRYPMVGLLHGNAKMTKKLGPFGYIDVMLTKDGLLGKKGDILKGHEFHYSTSDNLGADFQLSKMNGRQWLEGHSESWIYAGYPHIYLPGFAKSALFFADAMLSYYKRD